MWWTACKQTTWSWKSLYISTSWIMQKVSQTWPYLLSIPLWRWSTNDLAICSLYRGKREYFELTSFNLSLGLWRSKSSHSSSGRAYNGMHSCGQNYRIPVRAFEEMSERWRSICKEDDSCLCSKVVRHKCSTGRGSGFPWHPQGPHFWFKSYGGSFILWEVTVHSLFLPLGIRQNNLWFGFE